MGVLLLPLLVLPLGVPDDWIPPANANPVLSLLALLALTVGLPFFVVSTTAPLLQRWLSATDHRELVMIDPEGTVWTHRPPSPLEIPGAKLSEPARMVCRLLILCEPQLDIPLTGLARRSFPGRMERVEPLLRGGGRLERVEDHTAA